LDAAERQDRCWQTSDSPLLAPDETPGNAGALADRRQQRSGVPVALAGIILVVVGLFFGWLALMSPHHSETLPCRDPSPPHQVVPCDHQRGTWLADLGFGMLVVGFGMFAFASVRGAVRSFREGL
jgi:hypothetical protein